ncbi:HrcA family transcriptional regulator [Helicobacter sp. 11S02596-1]|uniref:HrcA family transcriptional regulator n=1 Tax=Helicobacter sp. 11S02596-1 TaxID=1476194 RepID=UPI000BA6BD82|nr:HrcA family transcriptional regulator [Helicobacter sp. 11S02596-1]PAF45149.1 hypothetical protein BJI48_00865 [Helicobacter sp. 11S02596-1]
MIHRKKDLLLDKIIQKYIHSQEPIGSEALKMSLSIKISSATIRNYFKLLSEEGVLMQPHISSGRVPTHLALKNYWRNKLNAKDTILEINIQKFQKACEENSIFGIIKENAPQALQEVINHNDRFLILDFTTDQIILPFNQAMQRFANELVGLGIGDIKKIAQQVCATTLVKKLEAITENAQLSYFGIEFLGFLLQHKEFQKLFFEIISGRIFDRLDKGIYFDTTIPKGNIAIIQDIELEKKDTKMPCKMFCMGALDRDYISFYEKIAS